MIGAFPLAGEEFAKWFASTYRLSEEIFDSAPLPAKLSVINRFLGRPKYFDREIKWSVHGKTVLANMKKYDLAIKNVFEIDDISAIIKNMSMETAINEFEKGRKEKEANYYLITIKDALVRTSDENEVTDSPKTRKASYGPRNDYFWDKATQQEEAPF